MKGKRIILLILFVVVFVAVWNILDMVYSSFITRSAYQFGIGDDLLIPLFIALIIHIPFIKR